MYIIWDNRACRTDIIFTADLFLKRQDGCGGHLRYHRPKFRVPSKSRESRGSHSIHKPERKKNRLPRFKPITKKIEDPASLVLVGGGGLRSVGFKVVCVFVGNGFDSEVHLAASRKHVRQRRETKTLFRPSDANHQPGSRVKYV
jgi:hypothetical protein